MGIFDGLFGGKKTAPKTNNKTVSEVKELLISNNCTVKLNVFEELDSSFQIMDSDGNVFSPNDSALRIDEGADLNDDDRSWKKGEKYTVIEFFEISRLNLKQMNFLNFLMNLLKKDTRKMILKSFHIGHMIRTVCLLKNVQVEAVANRCTLMVKKRNI